MSPAMRSEHPELARPPKRCFLLFESRHGHPCRLFLGPGFRLAARWNRLGEPVKTRKKTRKNGEKMGKIRPKKCEGVGITWQHSAAAISHAARSDAERCCPAYSEQRLLEAGAVRPFKRKMILKKVLKKLSTGCGRDDEGLRAGAAEGEHGDGEEADETGGGETESGGGEQRPHRKAAAEPPPDLRRGASAS